MVHERQRLALGFEPRDNLICVETRLDDLQRDTAADGMRLLGHVDRAHPTLADALEQVVVGDRRANGSLLGEDDTPDPVDRDDSISGSGPSNSPGWSLVCGQQRVHAPPQFLVGAAGRIQERHALCRRGLLQR
jgi:hypothetical protein